MNFLLSQLSFSKETNQDEFERNLTKCLLSHDITESEKRNNRFNFEGGKIILDLSQSFGHSPITN